MFTHRLSFRQRRRLGYVIGGLLGLTSLLWLTTADHAAWHSPGPANSGHTELVCGDCHKPADGTVRQQLQANLKQLFGLRRHASYFQYNPVDNRACLDCHNRPNDRHPVQRFNEPRFSQARQKLHPEQCTACHAEHRGVRVTQADSGYCRTCHQEFSLKHDPLDTAHQTLAKQQRWETCLGCHDFHGNHQMDIPTSIAKAIPKAAIVGYFQGSDSPYPGRIIHKAKEKSHEHKSLSVSRIGARFSDSLSIRRRTAALIGWQRIQRTYHCSR